MSDWRTEGISIADNAITLEDGREIVPIVYANELPRCRRCGEAYCDKHDQHYWSCSCLGPAQADEYGFERIVIDEREYAVLD